MNRHSEWWWRELYDENGEIGDQLEWDGSWVGTMKIKEFVGISTKKSEYKNKENVQKENAQK